MNNAVENTIHIRQLTDDIDSICSDICDLMASDAGPGVAAAEAPETKQGEYAAARELLLGGR
ncbi:MAG: hypothetical protein WC529_08080 [Candidatus Margulisiibacteriota bacterium]